MATGTWMSNFIVTWGPMLLLIVVWLFVMRRYSPLKMWQAFIARHTEHMSRIEAQLDRIAAALELVAKR